MSKDFYTDGKTYALLELPMGNGIIAPPRIENLIYCGAPQGIVAKLSFRYSAVEIARRLGSNHASVRRWVAGYINMRLSEEGWVALARWTAEAQSISELERPSKPWRIKG